MNTPAAMIIAMHSGSEERIDVVKYEQVGTLDSNRLIILDEH